MAEPTAPNIPGDAPQDVKDFFDCKGDKLVWKKGKVTWLGLGIDPDVSFEHGKEKGTIDITINFGFGISFTLNASVNAAGELTVDTSKIPDLSKVSDKLPGKKDVDNSIKNINDWFKKNGKKLKGATFKRGEVTLEKTTTTGAYAPFPVVPLDEDENQIKGEYVGLTPGSTPTAESDDETIALSSAPAIFGASQMTDLGEPRNTGSRPIAFLVGLLFIILLGAAVGFVFFGGQVPVPGPVAVASASPSPSASASASPISTASASPSATQTPNAPPSVSPVVAISGLCIRVVHEQIEQFISYLEWYMWWSGIEVDHFDVYVAGANDNYPVRLEYDPVTGAWYAPLGLNEAGDKEIVEIVAHLPDKSEIDVTDDLINYFGADTITVRYPQEDTFGDRCADAPSR